MSKSTLCKKNRWAEHGFTVVELIIVISIFSVLSGIVFLKFGDFTRSIGLDNVAQEIALKIRQAQNDSISGLRPEAKLDMAFQLPPEESTWKPSYGIFISPSVGSVVYNTSMVSFYDRDNNSVYDYDTSGNLDPFTSCDPKHAECLDWFEIASGEHFEELCVDDGTKCGLKNLTIVFKRPFPDAIIMYTDVNGIVAPATQNADIIIADTTGGKRKVRVTSLGQILVTRVN